MSVVPYLISELLDGYRRPTGEIIDQYFGMGLSDDIFKPFPAHRSLLQMPIRSGYLRPWRHLLPLDSGVSTVVSDSKEFKINLDVQQFTPDELKVTLDNGYVIVNGKHEERSDEHGFVSREFTRRYRVPDDVDQTGLVSQLSSDGVLSLKAPKLVSVGDNSIEVAINQTNKPARIHDDSRPLQQ